MPQPPRSLRLALPAGIFALALAVRLAYLVQMQASPCFDVPLMDADYHDRWARMIAGGEWLGEAVFFRAPLYPSFLGALYSLFGPDYALVRGVQFTLGALTCVLLYLLGARIGGRPVGVVAGVMAALYGPFVYFEGELLLPVLEALFAAALLLCLSWALPSGAQTPARPAAWWPPWLLAGLCIGLFAVTRPNILAFIPVLLGYMILRLGWRRAARAGAVCCLATALCILPVTLHNWVVGGDLVLISSQGGVNFYIGNNPRSDGTTAVVPGTRATWWGGYRDVIHIAERAQGRELRPSEVSSYWSRRAREFITSQPGAWLKLTGKKLLLFWYGHEIPNNLEIYPATWFSPVLRALLWEWGPVRFPFGLVAPLGLAGLALAVARRKQELTAPILFLAVYSLTVVAFFVCARFRIPCLLPLIVLAAYGVVEAPRLMRLRQGRALALPLVVLIAAGFVANHDFFGRGQVDLAKTHLDFAACYQQKDQLKEAEREYRLAVSHQPTRVEPRQGLAMCLLEQGRLDEARQLLEEVLRREPSRWEALVGMGDVLSKQERFEEALGHYRQAIAVDPLGSEAYARLAAALRSLGRDDEAAAALAQGYRGRPGDELIALQLAELAFDEGDYAEAARLARTVLTRAPDAIRPRLILARAHANLGETNEAMRFAREVLAAQPENAEALIVLGTCLWRLGRLDAAIEALERAVALAPDAADAWSVLGASYAYRNELDKAVEACTRALELNPDDVQARFVRAGCLYDLGRREEAARECRDILRRMPDFTPAAGLLQQIEKDAQ